MNRTMAGACVRGCMVALAAVMCACSPKGEAHAQDGGSMELPLPEVPGGLRQPRERAEYIMAHFWDGMDFGDTLRSRDTAFVELNFVNFISLAPYAGEDAVESSLRQLLETAARADHEALSLLCGTAEKYLSEPDSPMRDEELYISFLEAQLSLSSLTAAERLRPTMRLLTAKKNRPGTRAADFAYTTREGERRTLHGTDTRGLLTLMVFYDPACGHCTEILRGLEGSETIRRLTDDGKLAVLAIYTEGNRQLWDETKADMPQAWEVGMDESRIVDSAVYDLPAMPVLYLLSPDKTVLLKDPTPEAVERYLTE